MKILFLIENDPPIGAAYLWEEIKRHKDKGLSGSSKEAYSTFKALEQNKEFEAEILVSRKNMGIPEAGLLWNDYYFNYYMESLRTYDADESKKYTDFYSKLEAERDRIKGNLSLDPLVLDQLGYLIIGGFVFPENDSISYKVAGEDFEQLSINIKNKITKNELIEYIDSNWIILKPLVESLPLRAKYYISKRDFRIVELKDKEDMDFNEIVDQIIKEFGIDDFDGKVNIISVTRAYRRAKNKIKQAANYSKKNK